MQTEQLVRCGAGVGDLLEAEILDTKVFVEKDEVEIRAWGRGIGTGRGGRFIFCVYLEIKIRRVSEPFQFSTF